ncbi:hypothetical protein [Gilliamella apis]|uniref:hypothetical protein n=1 Tax=Gilliamella apis TaxID=1970738 RepID=UPI0015E8DBAE|nr:hypothetical protein [Gilliamella apis]WLS93254.1 hypothetical protein RAM17_08335 [Gilliamella apis]
MIYKYKLSKSGSLYGLSFGFADSIAFIVNIIYGICVAWLEKYREKIGVVNRFRS